MQSNKLFLGNLRTDVRFRDQREDITNLLQDVGVDVPQSSVKIKVCKHRHGRFALVNLKDPNTVSRAIHYLEDPRLDFTDIVKDGRELRVEKGKPPRGQNTSPHMSAWAPYALGSTQAEENHQVETSCPQEHDHATDRSIQAEQTHQADTSINLACDPSADISPRLVFHADSGTLVMEPIQTGETHQADTSVYSAYDHMTHKSPQSSFKAASTSLAMGSTKTEQKHQVGTSAIPTRDHMPDISPRLVFHADSGTLVMEPIQTGETNQADTPVILAWNHPTDESPELTQADHEDQTSPTTTDLQRTESSHEEHKQQEHDEHAHPRTRCAAENPSLDDSTPPVMMVGLRFPQQRKKSASRKRCKHRFQEVVTSLACTTSEHEQNQFLPTFSRSPLPTKQCKKVKSLQTPEKSREDHSAQTSDSLLYPWCFHKDYYLVGEQLHSNETCNLEFKCGQGAYLKRQLQEHVGKYMSAYLNSEGGTLLVGVNDFGFVEGVKCSFKLEDELRLQIDQTFKAISPQVFPNSYKVNFSPVHYSSTKVQSELKVIEVSVAKGPSTHRLYQTDRGEVYIRRDGSVQGPLKASEIQEWDKQQLREVENQHKIQTQSMQVENDELKNQRAELKAQIDKQNAQQMELALKLEELQKTVNDRKRSKVCTIL